MAIFLNASGSILLPGVLKTLSSLDNTNAGKMPALQLELKNY